ncbi:MAG: helix-turn-helix domain-containing protein [Candidatus Anstonellales archaeon]
MNSLNYFKDFKSREEIINYLTIIANELNIDFTLVSSINSCFDLIFKSEKLMFLKVYENINSFSSEIAKSLKTISLIFSANSFIIAQRDSKETRLAHDTIYIRHGLPVFSPHGFYHYLKKDCLFAEKYKKKGYKIDTEKMKALRSEMNLSYTALSQYVGISAKMLYLYENNRVLISAEKLRILEKFFNQKLTSSFERENNRDIIKKDENVNLEELEKVNLFSLEFYICSSPIDLTNSIENNVIGITYSTDRHTDRKLASVLSDMKKSINNFLPAFYRPSKRVDNYRNIPIIDSDEFKENSLIGLCKILKEKHANL